MPSLARVIAFGLFVILKAAIAGNILITDLGEGPPGVAAQGGAALAGLVCGAETCTFTINAPAGTAGTIVFGVCPTCGATGPPNINLFEDSTFVDISDTLQLLGQPGLNTMWRFTSDTAGSLPALAPSSDFVEDGTAQTVIRINYVDAVGKMTTDTIQVQSDVEAPEPSTWLMFLGGGSALWCARVIRSCTRLRKNRHDARPHGAFGTL
jgi:hypothetical protein